MNDKTITQTFLDRFDETRPYRLQDLPVLTALRQEASEFLQEHPLPRFKSEHYQRFDIDKALSSAVSYIDPDHRAKIPDFSDESGSFIFHSEAIRVCMSDGLVHDISDAGDFESGFFIGSVYDFAKHYPTILEERLGRVPSAQKDPLAALNTLFFDDAIVIYLRRGTKPELPIHLLHRSAALREGKSIAFPRLLLIAEEDTEVKVLLSVQGFNPDIKGMQNSLAEIYVDERAKVEFYILEESLPRTTHIHNVHSVQKRDSSLKISSLTIRNGKSRGNFFCDLAEEGAELNLDGLAILEGDRMADNFSFIRHSAPNCHSDELFKYTINDEARGTFSGMIYVAKDAQHTLAYQNNRNLLLAPKARMYSKPQLEIYADDVKCSHGLTTGELDENALFYLRQRGIPRQESLTMLTIAFMSDVIEKVNLPVLKERLYGLVEDLFRRKHTLSDATANFESYSF